MTARNRLLLDLAMFAGLLAAFNPELTGIAVHEWLSLAVVIPLLVHLIINWDWTVRVASTLLGRLGQMSALNLVVDVSLFVVTVACITSGLAVSQVITATLGIAAGGNLLWSALHSISAAGTIALLVVHVGLHWRWIVKVARRTFGAPATPALD